VLKEKERARKTTNAASRGTTAFQVIAAGKATSGGGGGDTRTSMKYAGIGLAPADNGSRRTLKEGKNEKSVKTPANSNKLFDNSTAAGISNLGDLSAVKSMKK
jgi:hypothetical protein